MVTVELSNEERKFLIGLLDTVQLSGKPSDVRQLLATVDEIVRKLRDGDKDKKSK